MELWREGEQNIPTGNGRNGGHNHTDIRHDYTVFQRRVRSFDA
jgi:hypothetical protein